MSKELLIENLRLQCELEATEALLAEANRKLTAASRSRAHNQQIKRDTITAALKGRGR